MTKWTITFFLNFIFLALFAQNTSKTSIHQVIPVNWTSVSKIHFNLQTNSFKLEKWMGQQILIETHIEAEGMNQQSLKNLAKTNRYNVKPTLQDDGKLIFTAREFQEFVFKGSPVLEKVYYVIYLPENLFYSLTDESKSRAGTDFIEK